MHCTLRYCTYILSYHFTSYDIISHHIMLFLIISYYFASYYIISYYVTLKYSTALYSTDCIVQCRTVQYSAVSRLSFFDLLTYLLTNPLFVTVFFSSNYHLIYSFTHLLINSLTFCHYLFLLKLCGECRPAETV